MIYINILDKDDIINNLNNGVFTFFLVLKKVGALRDNFSLTHP